MRGFAPRVVLTTFSILAITACAGPYEAPTIDPEQPGTRHRVLIPALEGPGGEQVAEALRAQVAEMATHTAVPRAEMRHAMRHYEVRDLDRIQAIQLADLMNAQAVTWGTVREEGGELVADLALIDVQTQGEYPVRTARAADQAALASAVYTEFSSTIEGVRMAFFCQEDLEAERWDEALRTCQQAVEAVPESPVARYGLGAALLRVDRYEDALTELEQVIEIDPEHEDALLSAGLAASRLDQRDVARGYYERYLDLRPDDAQVRVAVSHDIAQTGDYASAFRVLEPAIQEEGDDIEFQEYLGQIATAAGQDARARGDDAEARRYFDVAVNALEAVYEERGDELGPGTIRQMVAVYRETGREDAALDIARRATQSHADDAAIWQMYGQELARVDRHRDAIDAFTRAIDIDPDLSQIHLRRAISRIDAGERGAARRDLEEAAERGDRSQVAQFVMSRGLSAYQANNFDDAIALLSLANDYADSQQQSQIRFFWGMSLFRQGQDIARANTEGRAGPAERALGLFRESLPHFNASNHQQASEMASATQQFIDNQQAIIRAAQRGR